MCEDYKPDPELSKDTNAILKQLHCNENMRLLGHHVSVNGIGVAIYPEWMTREVKAIIEPKD